MRAAVAALGMWLLSVIAVCAFFLLALVFQTWPAEARGHNASIFCDRVTATGRGMDCGSMVFAHKTLPLGSNHRISCNGRIITARVVDRGPYVRGRDFDLSPGLARACGINGLGNVRLV